MNMDQFSLISYWEDRPLVLEETSEAWLFNHARLYPIKSFKYDHIAFSSSKAWFIILEASSFHRGSVLIV